MRGFDGHTELPSAAVIREFVGCISCVVGQCDCDVKTYTDHFQPRFHRYGYGKARVLSPNTTRLPVEQWGYVTCLPMLVPGGPTSQDVTKERESFYSNKQ